MGYDDRLRQCVFISPLGSSFTLQFDELSRTLNKKVQISEIPDEDSADIEDLGNAAIRFPMSLYISGQDYDQTADLFFSALSEKGPAVLEHPRYGNFEVLVLSVKQKEDFTDNVGRAIFDIEFVKFSEVNFPKSSDSNQSKANEAGNLADDTGAENFAEKSKLEKQGAINVLKDALKVIDAAADQFLAPLAALNDSINKEFTSLQRVINNTLDSLIGDPILLAGAYTKLFKSIVSLPGKTVEKLNGYKGMLQTVLGMSTPQANDESLNIAETRQYMGVAISGAIAQGMFFSDFDTKESIIETIESINFQYGLILAGLEADQVFFENNNIGDSFVIDSDLFNFLKSIIQATNDFLLAKSFELKTKKIITLITDRSPLELCYELYGSISFLDFFILSNNLSNDEFFIIPAGFEVVVYE